MGFCDKFKIDRVICDEIFYLTDLEEDVEVGEIEVPEESEIGGEITVTVLDCEPVITDIDIQVDLNIMVQKELTIITPDEMEIPLEFAERLPFTVIFRKCSPVNLEEIDGELLDDLECHVINVSGMDNITLTPSEGVVGTNDFVSATFTEELTIMVKLKLVQERQMHLSLCPIDNQFTVDI